MIVLPEKKPRRSAATEAFIVTETEKHLKKIINGTEYSIYDIEFAKEGPYRYLRVFIDKDGGIGLTDCEKISRELERALDAGDYIKQAYILEVSSPGINRRLKKEEDFVKYAGQIVDIKLAKPHEEKKEYKGELKCLNGENVIVIIPEIGEASFPLCESTVRLSL